MSKWIEVNDTGSPSIKHFIDMTGKRMSQNGDCGEALIILSERDDDGYIPTKESYEEIKAMIQGDKSLPEYEHSEAFYIHLNKIEKYEKALNTITMITEKELHSIKSDMHMIYKISRFLRMTDSIDIKRKSRSQEIADEVKAGTYEKAAFDKEASWWPERPVIKKDLEAMKKLYPERKEED